MAKKRVLESTFESSEQDNNNDVTTTTDNSTTTKKSNKKKSVKDKSKDDDASSSTQCEEDGELQMTIDQWKSDLHSHTRLVSVNQLSRAEYQDGLFVVGVRKGKHFDSIGHTVKGQLCLYVEEALYLATQGSLELYYKGMPLTLQEAYQLCERQYCNHPFYKFQVYSYLKKHGYHLIRFTPEAAALEQQEQRRLASSKYNNTITTSERAKIIQSLPPSGVSPQHAVAVAAPVRTSMRCRSWWRQEEWPCNVQEVYTYKPDNVEWIVPNINDSWTNDRDSLRHHSSSVDSLDFDIIQSSASSSTSTKPLLRIAQTFNTNQTMNSVNRRVRLFDVSTRLEDKAAEDIKDCKDIGLIDYNVYKPGPSFRKSSPGTPDFRISIMRFMDKVPSMDVVNRIQSAFKDSVPLYFCVIALNDISFFSLQEMDAMAL
ncbi:hypothetical protein SAMD00019534_042530, partial [Acytostelium subglobosum LB1]|uniref:hypothetical protein n=1 Tax=Acytostelium subglobosum LB1 TaxID=1410327 RepID=UPI000644B00D